MRIRPVTIDDADMLLAWRNDPETRAASRNTALVEPAEHAAWLRAVIDEPSIMLLIAVDDTGSAVGHVRFVPTGEGYEVSIVIAPEHRGHGYGREVLRTAQEAFQEVHQRESVRAYVRSENLASHRMFRAAGYVVTETDAVGSWYVGGPDA